MKVPSLKSKLAWSSLGKFSIVDLIQ
jgi:hypothetical protein